MKAIQDAPVTISPVAGDELRALRQNASSGKTLLVSVWIPPTRRVSLSSARSDYVPHVCGQRPADGVDYGFYRRVRHERGRSRVSQGAARHVAQPSSGKRCGGTGGFRSEMERGPATDFGRRSRWPGALSEEGRMEGYEVRRIILASSPRCQAGPAFATTIPTPWRARQQRRGERWLERALCVRHGSVSSAALLRSPLRAGQPR